MLNAIRDNPKVGDKIGRFNGCVPESKPEEWNHWTTYQVINVDSHGVSCKVYCEDCGGDGIILDLSFSYWKNALCLPTAGFKIIN